MVVQTCEACSQRIGPEHAKVVARYGACWDCLPEAFRCHHQDEDGIYCANQSKSNGARYCGWHDGKQGLERKWDPNKVRMRVIK